MKTCSRCGKSKELKEFYRNKWSLDYHRSECIKCSKVSNTRYCMAYRVTEGGKIAIERKNAKQRLAR